jgi:Xaa-Pro aminopeptidase
MLTTHPSIMLGSYVWDQDWLPQDEFRIRLSGLEKAMDDNSWAGVLVYGDGREHASLAWLSNFIPRMRWAMALLPRKGEPKLLVSMSSRDMPAMKTMTWIPDVVSGWEWKHFDDWVARQERGGVLGTIAFDIITPQLYAAVETSLGARFSMAEADSALASLRAGHRPRELALIRRGCRPVAAAEATLREAWAAGEEAERALLAAERTARPMAAQDVRTLVSTDRGRTLSPFRGAFDLRQETGLAYIAVKTAGYWADRFVPLSLEKRDVETRCQAALDRLVAAARPGVTADGLHEVIRRELGNLKLHPLTGGSLGHRIGLSLVEGPELTAGSGETLRPSTAYALRVGALDGGNGGAIASTMVIVEDGGAVDLLPPTTPSATRV